jgi:hypothetical protein
MPRGLRGCGRSEWGPRMVIRWRGEVYFDPMLCDGTFVMTLGQLCAR